jgi:hypothetical protein
MRKQGNATLRRLFSILIPAILVICLSNGLPVQAQQTEESEIVVFSPQPGEAVQGLVQIVGTVDPEGFRSYEVAFAFMDDATQTWFQVASGSIPVIQGVLAEWDTTVLTDSNYNLLLRVHFQNGAVEEIILEGIRVRNYSTIETSTPAPAGSSQVLAPTPTLIPELPTETPVQPTPTEIPENPAAVDAAQLTQAIKRGAIVGIVLVSGAILYSRTKRRDNSL